MNGIYTLIENSPSPLSKITLQTEPLHLYLDHLKIGVFDSGIGGLSIVKELKKYPLKSIFYFADTAYLPYGDKSVSLLLERACFIVSMMQKKGICHIIIACHTIASTVLGTLKKMFPTISFIDFLDATIKAALLETKNNKIGIWATRRTIGTHIHKKQLLKNRKTIKVFEKSCPKLVPLIESNASQEKLNEVMQRYLSPLQKKDIDTLILGCTHYAWLRKSLQTIAPHLTIISADHYVENLFRQQTPETPSIQISSSSNKKAIKEWAKKLL